MKTLQLLLLAVLGAPALFAAPTADYVAHEWGTFTSVQGADGEQMTWNPLTVWDLPKFVYSLPRPGRGRRPGVLVAGKSAMSSTQRMETPVIYFYAERKTSVDVAVDFPEGSITEWYPQALFPREKANGKALFGAPKGLRWPQITFGPAPQSAASPLPEDGAGSHYYAARQTDAAVLSSRVEGAPMETEKFLFYRGVASFTAPLTVTSEGPEAETLHLKNTGAEPIPALFVYRSANGCGRMLKTGSLAPGETRTVQIPIAEEPLKTLRQELGTQLRSALTDSGLFAREAAAMVQTWDDSWLGESGVRVLYVLPRPWTDRTLPLRLAPAPGQLSRVMVGRAEIITPAMEGALSAEVERFSSEDPGARAQALANTRKLALGRFAEPTMRRVMSSSPRSPAFIGKSWELLQATNGK